MSLGTRTWSRSRPTHTSVRLRVTDDLQARLKTCPLIRSVYARRALRFGVRAVANRRRVTALSAGHREASGSRSQQHTSETIFGPVQAEAMSYSWRTIPLRVALLPFIWWLAVQAAPGWL